jgi:hypothetical protein
VPQNFADLKWNGLFSQYILRIEFARKEQMPQQTENNNLLRNYLLGELSEQEQEQVERRLLSEDDFYEELLMAEDELIDDFVGDHLGPPDKSKFSQRFLTVPELQQDVRFARVLRKHAAESIARGASEVRVEHAKPVRLSPFAAFFRRPVVGFALAAALLLAVGVGVLMTAENRRLRTQVEQLRTPQTPQPTPPDELQAQLTSERQRTEQLAAELQREQEQRADAERRLEVAKLRQSPTPPRAEKPRSALATIVLTLTPGMVRDEEGGQKKISVPSGTGRVRVQLDLADDDYRSYRAVLKTVEGRVLFTEPNLRARVVGGRRIVSVNIPAQRLTPNDYRISLSGRDATGAYTELDTYNFRVGR